MFYTSVALKQPVTSVSGTCTPGLILSRFFPYSPESRIRDRAQSVLHQNSKRKSESRNPAAARRFTSAEELERSQCRLQNPHQAARR
jgi:hypothetical protein